MTIRQKRAISYAIAAKNRAQEWEFIQSHNLENEFKTSKYKTMLGFIKNFKKVNGLI